MIQIRKRFTLCNNRKSPKRERSIKLIRFFIDHILEIASLYFTIEVHRDMFELITRCEMSMDTCRSEWAI